MSERKTKLMIALESSYLERLRKAADAEYRTANAQAAAYIKKCLDSNPDQRQTTST